jgi:hypothetical protein
MPPSAKSFWAVHWWKVLLVFLVTGVVFQFAAVAIREGVGLPFPPEAAGAASGVTSVLIMFAMGRRHANRSKSGREGGAAGP